MSETSNTDSQDFTEKQFLFGKFPLPGKSIFYMTKHSMAFVNLMCTMPGHVLVAPIKPYLKFIDIPDEERDDLAKTVRFVNEMLRRFYKIAEIHTCFQNGEAAGMSVHHHHVHVMPLIAKHYPKYISFCDDLRRVVSDNSEVLQRNVRSREHMNYEAQVYRDYIKNNYNVTYQIQPYLVNPELPSATPAEY